MECLFPERPHDVSCKMFLITFCETYTKNWATTLSRFGIFEIFYLIKWIHFYHTIIYIYTLSGNRRKCTKVVLVFL